MGGGGGSTLSKVQAGDRSLEAARAGSRSRRLSSEKKRE